MPRIRFIKVENRSYGNALRGTKIYYEGKRPKGLADDGRINFGKNILETLKTRFKRFRWIVTASKDKITTHRGVHEVRTSQKTLAQMYSEQFSRNRDIKNDIIRHRFSILYPSHFKGTSAAPYVPGSLADTLSRASLSRLSSSDKDQFAKFIPQFIASESVGAVSQLRATTQLRTLEALIKDLAAAIRASYSETWWQTYIRKNILVMQQGYIKSIEKMNISIGTTKFPDFSLVTHDGYLEILEIKKPTTDLLRPDTGRDNYYWDAEISKALIQVENYIENVSRHADSVRSYIKDKHKIDLKVVRPRGIVLAGSASSFTEQKQKDDFRLLCQSIKNVTFVTYDELLNRLVNYVGVLKEHSKSVTLPNVRKGSK